MKDYNARYYSYEVKSLKIGDTTVTENLPTVGEGGLITIPGTSVTANIELTVSRTEITYSVTLTKDETSGAKFVDSSNQLQETDTASPRSNYVARIGEYDPLRYTYTVTQKIGTADAVNVTAAEISEDGKITISSETINGDIVLTVKRSENFTISVLEYVAGYSMVLLTETGVRDSDTFRYAYNGKPMYKIEAYKTDNHDVYAYLVQGAVEEADAYAAVTNGTADTKTIPAGNDVNGTGQEGLFRRASGLSLLSD